MKRTGWLCLAVLVACLVGCSGSSGSDPAPMSNQAPEETQPEAQGFLAGAAVVDISPTPDMLKEGVPIGGFGFLGIRSTTGGIHDAYATGLHDPIYARALVIALDGKTVAFAALDAAMIANTVIDDIVSAVAQQTGIPPQQVFINATHSHSAPDLLGYMGKIPESYRTWVIEGTVRALCAAYQGREPAELFVSSGAYQRTPIPGAEAAQPPYDRWTYNRRGWMVGDTQAPLLDAAMNVLEARTKGGKTIGVLINYGCHPVILPDTLSVLSRDFCGYLVDYAQQAIGAPVLFIQGALGDVNPADWAVLDGFPDNYAAAQCFGEDVARQALATMSQQTPVGQDLYVAQQEFQIKLDNVLLLLVLNIQKSTLLLDYDANGNLVTTQVVYVRLGKEIQLMAMPGETLTHLAQAIKQDSAQSMTLPYRMVCSQTTDTLMYLVPSAEWKSAPNPMPGIGDLPYEEMMCLSPLFGDACRDAAWELIGGDPGR